MNLIQSEQYFKDRCNEISRMCQCGDPWVFLCAATMIEYLTKMVFGKGGRISYEKFISTYFGRINRMYIEFEYTCGRQDLPLQMYLILRCGFVHQFSLIPSGKELGNGARKQSIILAHEMNGHKGEHLTHYTKNGFDSVIFTAEQFTTDLSNVVDLLFRDARTDMLLQSSLIKQIDNQPPITGIGVIKD